MLLLDMRKIGNKLLAVRKKAGMTQVEVAEAAGLSGRGGAAADHCRHPNLSRLSPACDPEQAAVQSAGSVCHGESLML